MQRLVDANLTLTQAWENFYEQEDEHEKLYEDYDILRDRHFEQCGFECCQQTIVNAPTVLTIPDNPTNGDVLKAIFGYVEERLDNPYNNKIVGVFLDGHRQVFLKDWWDAPYKNTKGE